MQADDQKKMVPIWLDKDLKTVKVIDQRRLPHDLVIADLKTVDEIIHAIKEMYVRGAPLIGVTAAWGVYLAALNSSLIADFECECARIKKARPTAVNLAWAVDKIVGNVRRFFKVNDKVQPNLIKSIRKAAHAIEALESENCRRIGEHGLELIREISQQKQGQTVNVLTHCNAGWLACVKYGTATAPIYAAFDNGIDIHVWVDETRPLNQGSRLTAWELGQYGVKHTVITDNAGGHLMQHGMVDMVIVGTDRTTYTGDVANKIGTYLKALAAKDNNIPFYVALPSSTFDWKLKDGVKEIPIEERNPDEVRYVRGLYQEDTHSVLVPPAASPAANYAFDVTPARLVTGFITEKGVCDANAQAVLALFKKTPSKKEAV